MYTITIEEQNCWLLVLERNIQNVRNPKNCCAGCRSNAFNIHWTVNAQVLIFYSLYGDLFDRQFSPT